MTTQKIQLAIKASPETVWNALVSPEVSPAYYYGFQARIDPTPGTDYSYVSEGREVIAGRVLDAAPGRSIRMTFAGSWTPSVAELPESEVTYELGTTEMAGAGVTRLTLTHEGLPDTQAARDIEQGWVLILSGLKTLLETGEPLIPAPGA